MPSAGEIIAIGTIAGIIGGIWFLDIPFELGAVALLAVIILFGLLEFLSGRGGNGGNSQSSPSIPDLDIPDPGGGGGDSRDSTTGGNGIQVKISAQPQDPPNGTNFRDIIIRGKVNPQNVQMSNAEMDIVFQNSNDPNRGGKAAFQPPLYPDKPINTDLLRILKMGGIDVNNPELQPRDKIDIEVDVQDSEGNTARDMLSIQGNKNDESKNGDMDEIDVLDDATQDISNDINVLEQELELLKDLRDMDQEELEAIHEAFEALKKADQAYEDMLSHMDAIGKLEDASDQMAKEEIKKEEVAHVREIENDVGMAENGISNFNRAVNYIERDIQKERKYEEKLEKLKTQANRREEELENKISRIENAIGADLNT